MAATISRSEPIGFSLSASPCSISSGIVYFEYDSFNLTGESKSILTQKASVMNQFPQLRVIIEGHCDERGTAEYNLALGQSRAKAVQDILTSYGVSSSRLSIISYGEEVPLDPAHTESAFAKNRRVHFSAVRDTPKR